MDAFGEIPQMPVPTDKTITMTDIDNVAVAALATRKNNDSVSDGPHWSAHRGCIVGPLVLTPYAKNGMFPATEDAGDPSEGYRSTEERCAQRLAARVEILSRHGRTVKPDSVDLVPGQSQARTNDLVHDDRPVRFLQTLDKNVELVAD